MLPDYFRKKMTGTELTFNIINEYGDAHGIKQKFDLNQSLYEMKRLILNLTDNKPFLLDLFMINSVKAEEFANKLKSNTINVHLDRESFNLEIPSNSLIKGFNEPIIINGL